MLRTSRKRKLAWFFSVSFFLALPIMLPGAAYAQCPTIPTAAGTYTVTYNSTSSSCTFTVPAGVSSIKVECWGGGGGGGSARIASSGFRTAGGGGKGGMCSVTNLSVSAGSVYNVTVGSGGAGGTNGGNGDAGGKSALTLSGTDVAWASGGNGGEGRNNTNSNNAPGGTTYNAPGTGSGTVFNGGNGRVGYYGTTGGQAGGGGGGGAGNTADGANAGVASQTGGGAANGVSAGGAGGASGGGAGGNGGLHTSSNGATAGAGGNTLGGGGGGAASYRSSSGTSAANGGAGARGEVRITYTVVADTYIAQYNSMSYGSSTWCAGETRNVTVSVTNTGTVTWTNPAIRFSYKWDADPWFDSHGSEYFSSSVAPGATVSKTFAITAPMTTGTNKLSFNLVREGICWFPDCHASNAVYVSPNITITAPSSTGLSSGDWLFTGAVSTTYETPENWLKWNGSSFEAIGVYSGQSVALPPQITDNVRIKPSGTCILNQPTVTNAADGGFTAPISTSANCNTMVVEPGATLSFHASNNPHLHIGTTFTGNGSIVPGTGRIKFVGTGAQTLNSSSSTVTFYQMNVGANSVTTINSNVTVTNLLNLNGIIITGGNVLYLSNATTASLGSSTGQVSGTFRRAIATNTSEYIFPMAVGSTMNTDRRQLNFINGNITGVSDLTCSVSASFKGSGNNTDANLDPLKAKHYAQTFSVVRPEAEWSLIPNAAPSGGSYGVKLFLRNFASMTDNTFTVLKRPDASSSFFDFDSFYLSAPIPSPDLAGRVYDGGSGYAQKNGFTSFSKFAVASAPTPLPVTLKNFSAHCADSEVGLEWATGSESNSQKFIVQRSRELVTWSAVAELPAAGNSNTERQYAVTDENPLPQVSYYRLLQVDLDGKQAVYGPISVSCEGMENGMILFPNPAEGTFFAEIFTATADKDALIAIFNTQGQLVHQRPVDLKVGTNSIPFPVELAPGVYVVKLIGKHDHNAIRLVIN